MRAVKPLQILRKVPEKLDRGNWSSFQLAMNLDQRISHLDYCPKRKDEGTAPAMRLRPYANSIARAARARLWAAAARLSAIKKLSAKSKAGRCADPRLHPPERAAAASSGGSRGGATEPLAASSPGAQPAAELMAAAEPLLVASLSNAQGRFVEMTGTFQNILRAAFEAFSAQVGAKIESREQRLDGIIQEKGDKT